MQKYLNILSKPIIMYLLRGMILLGVSFYVYNKIDVIKQKNILFYLHNILQHKRLLLSIACILVFVNWGIEALKWQVAAKSTEAITFGRAVLGVLSGLNIGILLPQSLGDYAGRIWHLQSSNRTDALSSVFLCHFSQFFVTCLGGAIGAVIFYINGLHTKYLNITLISSVLFMGLLSVLLTTFRTLVKDLFYKLPILVSHYHYLRSLSEMELSLILKILFLSLLRYLCFLTQFVLVLKAFEVSSPTVLLIFGVMLVFFLKSIVPSFNFLADLGIREFSALAVFSVLDSSQDLQILAASFAIWFINLFVPSILGIFTIFTINITPKQ